jgi:hypothetical protein
MTRWEMPSSTVVFISCSRASIDCCHSLSSRLELLFMMSSIKKPHIRTSRQLLYPLIDSDIRLGQCQVVAIARMWKGVAPEVGH